MNSRLDLGKKIEKMANEPISFYLHKKGDFIERLKTRPKTRMER